MREGGTSYIGAPNKYRATAATDLENQAEKLWRRLPLVSVPIAKTLAKLHSASKVPPRNSARPCRKSEKYFHSTLPRLLEGL